MRNNHNQENKNNRAGAGERIYSMEAFAEIVKNFVGDCLGDGYSVLVQTVRKNNGIVRTGICIREGSSSITPYIYLDGCFEDYQEGRPMENICRDILHMYAENREHGNFDISSVTDFRRMQGRICFKLVNAERNSGLLDDMPHLLFHDLAVVFYIAAGMDFMDGISTVAVKNSLKEMWGVDSRTLYAAALWNTQGLFHSSVKSMTDVLKEMFVSETDGDGGMDGYEPFSLPLYVATNSSKFNGAAVILYPGLLERFADKHGSFYILPSSIHEVLFLPCSAGFEAEEVRGLVHSMNRMEVLPEEFLSDNVYRYDRDEGRVETV